MPIYPYACTACGHEFDALQKISDDPLTECPACGETALRKRLAAPAFQLKGTGWYETDFKNTGKKADKENDKSNKSDQDKTTAAEGKKQTGNSDSGSGSGVSSKSKDAETRSKAAAGGKDD